MDIYKAVNIRTAVDWEEHVAPETKKTIREKIVILQIWSPEQVCVLCTQGWSCVSWT